MKIVQVIHTFLPVSQAGSEIYTFKLSKELAKGHEVTVCYRIADANRPEYEVSRGRYEGLGIWTVNNTFKNFSSFGDSYRNDIVAKKFGELLDEINPDIVHFHHVTCLSTACVHEASRRNIPIVFTLHDFWLICPRGQFVKRDLTLSKGQDDVSCVQCMAHQLDIEGGAQKVLSVLERLPPRLSSRSSLGEILARIWNRHFVRSFFSRQKKAIEQIRERTRQVKDMCAKVDLFISPSQIVITKFKEFGIPDHKMVYSDYGFDVSRYAAIQKTASPIIRFGYIGTLIPTKGVHILIEAFNRVNDPRADLKIWGKDVGYDGVQNYQEYLQSIIKSSQIKLMGEYKNHRIAEVLSDIDVLVVPSIWYENSPLTIHEAFLAKVPVIASRAGGMAELVRDGVSGLLFRMGDAEDLASQIKQLISDPSMIKRLSNNCPAVKTIASNSEEILQMYEKLAACRRQG